MLNKNSFKIFLNSVTGALIFLAAAVPTWAIKGTFSSSPSASFFQRFVGWGFLIMLLIPPFVPFLIIFIWNLCLPPQNKKTLIGLFIANIVLIFLVTLVLFMQEKYPISFFAALIFCALNIGTFISKIRKNKISTEVKNQENKERQNG